MNIIQTYCTFGGERLSGGFNTTRAMVEYLKDSIKQHIKLDSGYKIYTDEFGFKVLSKFLDGKYIEVIAFDFIDDRYLNVGKLQTQELQTKPYVHVDLDATLFELPVTKCDIITEMIRGASIGRGAKDFNLRHESKILCSGVIGFNDLKFKDLYIKSALNAIKKSKNRFKVDFESMWTVEELLLTILQKDNNKSFFEIKGNISYEHLQGAVK